MAKNPSNGSTHGRARMMKELHEKGDLAAHVLVEASREGAKKTKVAAKKTAAKASETLERAQNSVTQSEAFEEINATLEEMAFVIGVQHARISDLELRLADLQQPATAGGK